MKAFWLTQAKDMPPEQTNKVQYFDICIIFIFLCLFFFSFVYECLSILQIKKRGNGIFLDPTLCISHNTTKR